MTIKCWVWRCYRPAFLASLSLSFFFSSGFEGSVLSFSLHLCLSFGIFVALPTLEFF